MIAAPKRERPPCQVTAQITIHLQKKKVTTMIISNNEVNELSELVSTIAENSLGCKEAQEWPSHVEVPKDLKLPQGNKVIWIEPSYLQRTLGLRRNVILKLVQDGELLAISSGGKILIAQGVYNCRLCKPVESLFPVTSRPENIF